MARLLSGGCAYFAWSGAGAGDLSLNTARLAREEGGAEADYLANKVTRLLDCTEDGYNGHTVQLLHLPYTRAQVDTSAWLARLLLGSLEIRTVYSGATQIRWRLTVCRTGD